MYDSVVNPNIPVRRVYINCNKIVPDTSDRQMTLFDENDGEARDVTIQETLNKIQYKYGKNAVFKGMDLEESATTLERNEQIGGHRK